MKQATAKDGREMVQSDSELEVNATGNIAITDGRPYSSHVFILPFRVENLPDSSDSQKPPEDWKLVGNKNEAGNSLVLPYFTDTSYFVSNHDKEKVAANQFDNLHIEYTFNNYFNSEVFDILSSSTINYTYDFKGEPLYYQIKIYDSQEDDKVRFKVYELDVKYIVVRLIDPDHTNDSGAIGIKGGKSSKSGFLIISTDNNHYPDSKDMARISQFGRQVYPPFFGDRPESFEHPLDITLSSVSQLNKVVQKDLATVYQPTGRIVSAVGKLLNSFFEPFGLQEDNLLRSTKARTATELELIRVLDNRMFVHAHYKFNQFEFNQLADGYKGVEHQAYHSSAYSGNLPQEIYNYQKELYKYIYVDASSSSCQSPVMVEPLLRQSVYGRWVDWGTLYGVCQHAMVMLTTNQVPSYLLAYFYTEYLEMILLVLTQRISILSFSARAGDVAKKPENQIVSATAALQKDYIFFKNQFLLPELSSHEQPIELYQMMQDNLYVNKQKEILDDQIQSLFEFNQTVDNQNNQEKEKKSNTFLLALSTLTFFTGFNDVHGGLTALFSLGEGRTDLLGWIILVVYACLVTVILKRLNLLGHLGQIFEDNRLDTSERKRTLNPKSKLFWFFLVLGVIGLVMIILGKNRIFSMLSKWCAYLLKIEFNQHAWLVLVISLLGLTVYELFLRRRGLK